MLEHLRELRLLVQARLPELGKTQRDEAENIIEDIEWMILNVARPQGAPASIGRRLAKIIYRLGSSGILDV